MTTPRVPERDRVTASYAEALRVVEAAYPAITQWSAATPCGQWTVLDLSGHLLAIARYWHRLLDAAEAGNPAAGLPRGHELAAMNARDLRGLADLDGPQRFERFSESASEHLRRIEGADWDVVLGDWSGLGPLTIGQHSGVAIGEWHVHAWDIARAVGADHRPNDAAVVTAGNRVVRSVSEKGDPWLAVLAAYGRDIGWKPSTADGAGRAEADNEREVHMTRADENRTLIEAFWADLYRPDLATAAARFGPEGEYTDITTPDDDVARGPDEIVRRLTLAWDELAGLHDERRHLVAGDDVVITEHVESWDWPTGESMALPVTSVHEIEDGRITRWTDYWDMATLVAAAPQWWFEHVMQGWK